MTDLVELALKLKELGLVGFAITVAVVLWLALVKERKERAAEATANAAQMIVVFDRAIAATTSCDARIDAIHRETRAANDRLIYTLMGGPGHHEGRPT